MARLLSLLLTALALVASLHHFAHCQSCDSSVPQPLSIPIRNVSLEGSVIRRGVAVSVGTPPQPLAFAIDQNANNTFVFDESGQCNANTPPIQCTALNGGAFDESSSSTWTTSNTLATPEAPEVNVTGDLFGSDTIHFDSGTYLTSFPLAVPRSQSFAMNVLGLGRDSTILNGLKNSGAIASRSYSVFWGLTGAEEEDQMDGNLVLGGYDVAKVAGQNYTSDLTPTPTCPQGLLTLVTDITMNFPNGTDHSIIGESAGSALQMCIAPNYEIITIPLSIWTSFQAYAGGTYIGRSFGLNFYGELFAAEDVYDGDLSFQFSTGLEIRIPNQQLVVPDITIDSSGNTIFNDSTREVLLNSDQQVNLNDMPLLGMTFLTSAYLSVNFDHGSFSLWRANPTTDEQLVGIGQNVNGCAGSSSSASPSSTASEASASSSSSSSSSSTASHSNSSSTHLSTGVIIAIVVTGFVVVAAAIVFLFSRRRKHKNKWRQNTQMRDYPMGPISKLPAELDPLEGGVNNQSELSQDNYAARYTDTDWTNQRQQQQQRYQHQPLLPYELDCG